MQTNTSSLLRMRTFTVAVLLAVFVLTPFGASAQCGNGFTGFTGPTTINVDEFGVGYGFFGGSSHDWEPATVDARFNSLDLLDPENALTFFFNLFTQPFARAQCGSITTQQSTEVEAYLEAVPGTITRGQTPPESSILTWSSVNALYCSSPDFSTGGATEGSVSVSPADTTNYTVSCSDEADSDGGKWELFATDTSDFACPLTDMSRGGWNHLADCPVADPSGTSCTAGTENCKTKTATAACTMETAVYSCGAPSAPDATAQATVRVVGACTPAYNSEEWYTSATMVLSTGIERSNQPLDCMEIPMYSGDGEGIQYWNRDIIDYESSNGSEVYDPIGTQCWYYTTVTGTEPKPPYYNEQGWDEDHFYDSGSVCTTAPVTECSDGIDNEPDGAIDMDDAGCDGPLDDDESDEAPECSDGLNNDNEGGTDLNDPGCDGGDDDDESDNPQCSDGSNNNDTEDSLIDFAGGDLGCEDARDTSEFPNPSGPSATPHAYIKATPTRVKAGTGTSQLSWSAQNVTSCTVTGTNGFGPINLTADGTFQIATGTPVSSGTISTQSIFTISCSPTVSFDAIVNVEGNLNEF